MGGSFVDKENVGRVSNASASFIKPLDDRLQPLYTKHSGSFIGKGTKQLIKNELDDSALVYNQTIKKKKGDASRQSISVKEVNFHNRPSV